MNKLLKDAIADAKAVRETALANAKAALEEAFAPKLQSMLSHKIKEDMKAEEGEESSEEEQMEIARMQKNAGLFEEDDEPVEDEPVQDAPVEDEPAPEEEEYEEEEEEYEEEPVDEAEEGEGEITDKDLEEILRELEGEESSEEEETLQAVAENESEDPEAKEMDEEIDLDEIIRALREEEEEEEEGMKNEAEEEEKEEMKAELDEAYGVIKFLRSKLNEVNLLNAKLLYVNKLFRKGQLTESQKVKIIETFDRAKNVREAKLIYATLSESVNGKSIKPATPKKKMNEGLASAPQKSTKIITESNNLYNRFKTLVDYNKH